MRPIDADKLRAVLKNIQEHTRADKSVMADSLSVFLDYVLEVVDNQPTIALPSNAPLTLEELREMPLHEWCWVERKMKPGYYCKFRNYIDEKSFRCGWPGSDIFSFDYEDYGKTWLAYRCKPEEAAK